MVLLICILVVAVLILASVVIALGFPGTPAGTWIVTAWKDVFSFGYREAETLLSLLKYPYVVDDSDKSKPPLVVMKYSSKRLVAIGLPVLAFVFIGVPKDWYQVTVMGLSIAAAAFLLWYAARTKT